MTRAHVGGLRRAWLCFSILSLFLLLAQGALNIDEDGGLTNNGIDIDGQDARSPRDFNKDEQLIDQVLNSDYFTDDEADDDDDREERDDAPPAAVADNFAETFPSLAPAAPVVGVPSASAAPAPVVEEEVSTTKNTFCLGCPFEVDVEDPKVKEMALFAFHTHLNGLGAGEQVPHLVRVVNAMMQIVAGQKYNVDLEVGVTNCTKAEHDADSSRCEVDPVEETFVCNFEIVEQKWLDKKEVVRSNCKRDLAKNKEDTDGEETDAEKKIRKKRQVDSHKELLGKAKTTTESKEKLMELAEFAVRQLDTIDADDESRFAVEVLESKKQTVSGWLYDITVRVAHTTCKENQNSTWEQCKDKMVPPYRICSVKILFQPWQEVQKKVTQSQCYPEKAYYKTKSAKKLAKSLDKADENEVFEKQRGRATSEIRTLDTTSKEMLELGEFIVESLDRQSNALHAQKLVKIHEAKRQLVSGLQTKVVIELGYTMCRKKSSLDKAQCDFDQSREHQFCNVTVWEKPWMKKKEITHSKCGPKESVMDYSSRTKRSLSMFRLGDLFTSDEHKEFKSFMAEHGKVYADEKEYFARLGIFKENMRKVKLLQGNEQGTGVYGATVFADLTEEEFAQRHLGLRPDLRQGRKINKKAKVLPISLPQEFDWRNYNAVTPVKNQGMCGSCWAFSVTGNIEGLYAKKHNKLLSFSEQELVDCDTMDEGCNGGLPENAYKAIEKLGGLETESAYPYDGHNDKCAFNLSQAAAQVKGFVELPKNETEMAMWLVKNGPISIGINANAMQFYMGGVSHPWKYLCSKKNLDHGVLIVGYGLHTTTIRHKVMPYWLVKNSWGPNWGEKGYYRVYRGENTCGLAEMATSAVVE